MRIAAPVLFSGALFAAVAVAQQPAPAPVMQPAQHRCELSPDKKIVSLSVSNPGGQLSECSVTCYLPYKGGTATITCTKFVDANAQLAPLCAHGRDKDGTFVKLERSTGQCSVTPVQLPPSVASKADNSGFLRYKDYESMSTEEKQIDYFRRR